jgi:hypothetical protein
VRLDQLDCRLYAAGECNLIGRLQPVWKATVDCGRSRP